MEWEGNMYGSGFSSLSTEKQLLGIQLDNYGHDSISFFFLFFIYIILQVYRIVLRESIPRQVDKKFRFPRRKKGVWGSQGGGRGLEFSRRRKGHTFFLYIP